MSNLLDKVDVLVIGGGISGCVTARELSKFKYDVALVERHEDVSCECSRAADGGMGLPGKSYLVAEVGVRPGGTSRPAALSIGAFDLLAGTMTDRYYKDLNVEYRCPGRLNVAFNDKQLEVIRKVLRRLRCRLGVWYGELITDVNRIRELEPNISPEVIGAWVVPWAINYPWELVIAVYENARQNGARAHFNTEVTNIVWQKDKENFLVETNKGDIEARYIVNAAGFGAAKLARMIGDDSFAIGGARQDHITLDEAYCKGIINHSIRAYGEDGVFKDWIYITVGGELLLGRAYFPLEVDDKGLPKYEEDFYNTGVSREGMEITMSVTKKLIPSLPIAEAAISAHAGVWPNTLIRTKDGYVARREPLIKPSEKNRRFVNFTPVGVGGAPALGLMVLAALTEAGLPLELYEEKDSFNPIRPPLARRFRDASNEERDRLIAKDPRYGHVVCRCKYVTEAEVVEAIRRGATTYTGVKQRTGAGMGRCQGGFDKPRILAILARELGIPQTAVTIKGGTSVETMYRSKELLKGEVEELEKRLKYVEPKFDSAELKKSHEELPQEVRR